MLPDLPPRAVDLHSEQLSAIRTWIQKLHTELDSQIVGAIMAPTPAASDPSPASKSSRREEHNDLGEWLSPSQANTFLGCSARWWFKYGLGLPDPMGAAGVRGKVVHRVAEAYYRARLAGAAPSFDDLQPAFDLAWEEESEQASFAKDDDLDAVRQIASVLSRKYIAEAAPAIQPAACELNVTGQIAGVPVRGFVDLLDVNGRIVDVKTKGQTPSGISPDHALQLATYRQLTPRASGQARLDVLVPNKTPKLVTFPHTVSAADIALTEKLYPQVREGIKGGLFFPNRTSTLCSRKYCPFADQCEREFGGTVE